MATRRRTRSTLRGLLLLLAGAAVAACSNAGPSPGPAAAPAARAGARSTQDARVKSFAGQVPPDVLTNGSWVSRAGPTSLAALRGRVVFLQFAFPQ